MAQSILGSFDPFGVHPFTNNSGLAPPPPRPSQYAHPVPSPPHYASARFGDRSTSHTTSPPPPPQAPPKLTVSAPSPQRPGQPIPIFVPFRQETSSPELSDVLVRSKAKGKGAKH
ncbi:hypothetical protein PLICRDRAFT_40640 [Plicaturopsis crispa FD-325 SS-3]|nr:hypothetical protein PLICRDRAFT_40640 [Plicaturopsis crispa FD-325 SS-3]